MQVTELSLRLLGLHLLTLDIAGSAGPRPLPTQLEIQALCGPAYFYHVGVPTGPDNRVLRHLGAARRPLPT